MGDVYDEHPEELARFYAARMAQGFGPTVERKLDWARRDAENAGDRRRARFWERVRKAAAPMR